MSKNKQLVKKLAGSLKPSKSPSAHDLDEAIKIGKKKHFQKKYKKLQNLS